MKVIHLNSGEVPVAYSIDDRVKVQADPGGLVCTMPVTVYLNRISRANGATLAELAKMRLEEEYACCLGLIDKRMKGIEPLPAEFTELREARDIWGRLSTVCLNGEDEIDTDFYATQKKMFSAGEEVTEIWHWLEETYNVSVHDDLMGTEN